jgi:hypothetical protein
MNGKTQTQAQKLDKVQMNLAVNRRGFILFTL